MNMQNNLVITVYDRMGTGKSSAHKTRAKGLVPGIVYGPTMKENQNVCVDLKSITKVYKNSGRTTVVTLESDEKSSNKLMGAKVLINDIQVDTLKNRITHVDFNQIDLNKKLRVTVPLNFTGTAKGIKDGGILSIATRNVEIRSLPNEIPAHIDVDISALDINDSYKLSELESANSGFEFIYEGDIALATVAMAAEEKEPTASEVAAAAADAAAPAAEGAAATPADASKAEGDKKAEEKK